MTGPRADVEIPIGPDGGPPFLPDHRRGSRLLGNRAFLISTSSTVLFLAVVVSAVMLAPGFREVRAQFLNLHDMKEAFFGNASEGLPPIWRGFLLNVEVFLVAEVFILILALVIAVIRQIPGPVFFPFRMLAVVYTDLFRGTPILLVMYIFGFGIPALSIRGLSTQSVTVYGTA